MTIYRPFKMPEFLLLYRAGFIALLQIAVVLCSLVLAWMIRFDFLFPNRRLLIAAAPILILARLPAMAYFGLLRGWWRYAGVKDGVDILKAVAAGSLLFWLFMRYVLPDVFFPRSIYLLEPILTFSVLIGVRLLSRALAESVQTNLGTRKRVMVIGAGFAAHLILREINLPDSAYEAVGCLDDDPSKLGVRIHNVPVIGRVDELAHLCRKEPVDEVIIAIPSATGEQMRRFIEICDEAKVKFRTVPSLREVIAGQVSINQLREVSPMDLLGRKPIQIDLDEVRNLLRGRTVLVTGAAGSIGSELCRQILEFNPLRLICVDQNETGLFNLHLDLAYRPNESRLVNCISNIIDRESLWQVLSTYRPQIIFHAAAYKHVPLLESNVQEAVKNNVFGFINLLDLAEEAGCESLVLISSDKAVNPTNVMGTTKRICELIIASRPANGMRAVSVRFGNVLGSQGSIVPVLLNQLRNDREMTITHHQIKRFFMITHEAVALVLQAFALGNHGEILVLDMGEPIRILDLARSLIRLSGKSEKSVRIRFTGLRPGEKFEEELFYPTEEVRATSCEKIKRIQAKPGRWSELQRHIQELRASLSIDGSAPVRAKLKEIVPEYSYELVPRPEPLSTDRNVLALEKTAAKG